jgi:small subunit ribosomal protein S13
MKEIVRIANTDLDGKKKVVEAIKKIKGIGHTFARAVVWAAKIDPEKKLGELSDAEIERIEAVLKDPKSYGIPSYLLNRRKDLESGEDFHLVGDEVDIKMKFDIQREMELRSWKGIRHMYGLPVRGRRLRGTFRRGKRIKVPKKKEK